MIDNFDSFTFNLVHYLEALGAVVEVKRNNDICIAEIIKLNPSHIVLSPGPGNPSDSGVCTEIVKQLKGVIPILGVCLGHQVIGQVFGAKVCRASNIKHGKTSSIIHNSKGIFKNIPQTFNATRYHSLTLDTEDLPIKITKTAWCFDNDKNNKVLMGIEIEGLNLYGVQFHPESIASEYGETLLNEFLMSKV
ncbi:MAG: aminodeoxychorismate/anthranilate synthase component II [Gammaproteobacteria bacterium]|nr:MAG: aminodeoxychorismate/anthranilate synthase component II [Gammaproteobacteria bacterium]